MRNIYQLLIVAGLLFSSNTHAVDFYADALYWQASETIDWAYTNSLSPPNQVVAYQAIQFDYDPGFRVGIGLQSDQGDFRVIYTRFYTRTNESATGNIVSAFTGSKFAETFYGAGQVNFTISFNMFDADFLKPIHLSESLIIKPSIGLRGGWIDQSVNASFQGTLSVLEEVTNNFWGFGPKAGVESKWFFYQKDNAHYSLVADFASSYMWGKWSIHDILYQNNATRIFVADVGKRDLGAFAVQGLLGINLDYNNYSIKLGYEISDWFDQYQVLDDASGAHNNDLVLQGLTLAVRYRT